MILLLLVLNTTPIVHAKVPCWMVRAYVDLLGPEGATAKGRALGYTDADMDAVKKRCHIK